ncbi:Pectin lyase-like superfamily protein [Perilla frutescens var. frutescens]|nr:Pectin lyase-like superfamily protein [Perilla frutescens var. frutescens]
MASGSSFDASNFLDDDEWAANITEQNQRVDRIINDVIIHAAELSLQPTNRHVRAPRHL